MSRTNRRRKPTTLPLGTLAEATTRADHWIDGLLPELQALRLLKADRAKVRQLAAEYAQLPSGELVSAFDDEQAEQADGILEELTSIAENYLPPFSYIGTLEGDGACFGVWASVESAQQAVQEGEIWQALDDGNYRLWDAGVTDALSVPRGALYLSVSDHGNVSLYQSLGKGRSREIWGVV